MEPTVSRGTDIEQTSFEYEASYRIRYEEGKAVEKWRKRRVSYIGGVGMVRRAIIVLAAWLKISLPGR